MLSLNIICNIKNKCRISTHMCTYEFLINIQICIFAGPVEFKEQISSLILRHIQFFCIRYRLLIHRRNIGFFRMGILPAMRKINGTAFSTQWKIPSIGRAIIFVKLPSFININDRSSGNLTAFFYAFIQSVCFFGQFLRRPLFFRIRFCLFGFLLVHFRFLNHFLFRISLFTHVFICLDFFLCLFLCRNVIFCHHSNFFILGLYCQRTFPDHHRTDQNQRQKS